VSSPAVEITDADDPRVAAFRLNERGLNPRTVRRENTPAGLFVAEGDLVAERALVAGCRAVSLLASAPFTDRVETMLATAGATADVFVASDDIRRAVTGLGVPLDVVGLFERPALEPADQVVARASRLVVIDRVDNPTNVGAIVRSVAALGADALLLDRTSADPLTRRALRVSMGTAFSLPTARVTDAAEALHLLHAAGFVTVALTLAEDSVDIAEVTTSVGDHAGVALLLGAERTGLDPATQAGCTHRAVIPMHAGVDSLNVAAASAVAAYALFAHR
jgi:tRNA G18 (ribose-2'-O)-methylase SpoU